MDLALEQTACKISDECIIKRVALSPEVAQLIIRKGIGLVGIDYLSIQIFKYAEPLTHRTLLKARVIVVEGPNSQNVPPGIYQLICLPVKLTDCDGAPTWAVLLQEYYRLACRSIPGFQYVDCTGFHSNPGHNTILI